LSCPRAHVYRGGRGWLCGVPVADVVFSFYGRFPAKRPAFVADTLHTVHELGLQYNVAPSHGRTVHQPSPGATATVYEEREQGDPA
jgi:hypothetical protein